MREKNCKCWKYIVVFCVPVICMLIYMLKYQCYPFGDNTILIGDADVQYYPFMKMLLDKLKNGESLFWDWNSGMGSDFYSNFFYYLSSPFNIIALLIGLVDLKLGISIVLIIQWALCGVTMLYYLENTKVVSRNKKESTGGINIIFALAYAMCDFMLVYQHNYIWLISLIMAPIAMLGVEKIIYESKYRLYFFSMIVVFVTNFYFAWFICILSVLWYIDQSDSGWRNFIKKSWKYIGTSVISACISAVVLIPCYYMVLHGNGSWTGLSVDDFGIFGNIGNFFQSMFWAHFVDSRGINPTIYAEINYCGIYVLALCFIFFLNTNGICRKKKIKRFIELIVMSICLNSYYASYVLHGFAIPRGSANRYAFIFVILLIITARDGLLYLKNIRWRDIIITIMLATVMVLIVILFNNNMQNLYCYLGSILLFTYIILCMVFLKRKSITKRSFIINIVILAFVEIISNFFISTTTSYKKTVDDMINARQWESAYQSINLENLERKTTYVNNTMYLKYSTTNMFSSAINKDLIKMYDKLGLFYQRHGRVYAYRHTTPVTAALFNVRYVLSDNSVYYGGYSKKEGTDNNEVDILENDNIIGLGYMVSDEIEKWNMDSDDPLEVQNNYTRDVLGVDDVFRKAQIEKINIETNGCNIININGLECSYVTEGNNEQWISYMYSVTDKMDMYVYVYSSGAITTNVFVDGKLIEESSCTCPKEVLHIGEVRSGQNVKIKVNINTKQGKKNTVNLGIYQYDDEIMQKCVSEMKRNIYHIDDVKSRGVVGTVNVDEDGELYTSIPYYKGFSVYVDGKKEKVNCIGGVCGVRLTAGTHIVEFKYFPYGLKSGIFVSALSVVLVVFYKIKMKRRSDKKITPQPTP